MKKSPASEMAKLSNKAQKKKYGKGYKKEMSRRALLKFNKTTPQKLSTRELDE